MTLRDLGLVSQVFDEQKLRALTGDMAHRPRALLDHRLVRLGEPQPVYRSDHREVALAHNGNLINAVELHAQLSEQGMPFRSARRLGDHRRAALHARRPTRSRTPSPR